MADGGFYDREKTYKRSFRLALEARWLLDPDPDEKCTTRRKTFEKQLYRFAISHSPTQISPFDTQQRLSTESCGNRVRSKQMFASSTF